MKRIYYKSDFDFILRLKDCRGRDIGFPTSNWTAKFWTSSKLNPYVASCINGECVNCFNDGGQIHILADNHRLSQGQLEMELTIDYEDAKYPDGHHRIVIPGRLEITLVTDRGDCLFDVATEIPNVIPATGAVTMETLNQVVGEAIAEHSRKVRQAIESADIEDATDEDIAEIANSIFFTAEADAGEENSEPSI